MHTIAAMRLSKNMPGERRYRKPTEERLTRAAVHYLDRYASTQANLKQVLERKVYRACHALELDPSGFTEIIETVVTKYVRNGMVNDAVFAEMKTASLRRKGQSRRKIEAQLRTKGVPDIIVTKVLEDDETDDGTAALAYARRRRLGPYADPAKRADRRTKDLAAMCRAGFDFETARRVIDMDRHDIEEN